MLENGIVFAGNPSQGDLRALPLRVRSLQLVGSIRFQVPIPLGCVPVVFLRVRVQLGTKVPGEQRVRLFLGWEREGECSLWEFGGAEPRHHDRR